MIKKKSTEPETCSIVRSASSSSSNRESIAIVFDQHVNGTSAAAGAAPGTAAAGSSGSGSAGVRNVSLRSVASTNDNGSLGEYSKSSAGSAGSRLSGQHRLLTARSLPLMIATILIVGGAAAAAFLALGITSAKKQESDEFHRVAADTVYFVESAFQDYVNAASMVHGRCRDGTFSRRDFSQLHQYLMASGLHYKAVQFDPNVTHEDRASYEESARLYYSEYYPAVNYQGFRGFNEPNGTTLEPRTVQPFYFPIHYMEPIPGNEAAIDLDYYSSESRIRAVTALFDTKRPSLTDRLSLVKRPGQPSRCGNHTGASYGVVLMHPGVPLTEKDRDYEERRGNNITDEIWPKDFSSIVLCIPDLLQRATAEHGQSSIVYLHDQSTPDYVSKTPVFMGGVRVLGGGGGASSAESSAQSRLVFLNDVELADLRLDHLYLQENVRVANRVWTVTVAALPGTYRPHATFVVVGGVMIFCAAVALAVWLFSHQRRTAALHRLQASAEAERASLILSSAQRAARAERELNDFFAHEVRNPVAAAMAANNFVKMELARAVPVDTEQRLAQAREDVGIVDNALRFVSDLLRNMLDMHRAATKQLHVTMAPADLLHDVLEPVGGMLYQRGSKVKLIVDCPQDLFVMTDCLRLKQVCMNLGRNSSKFIDAGFIRFKAVVVDGHVRVYVDDSGCGIPADKCKRLFAKYQESLDLLNQGTGIGLYLCKLLVELMGGEISLDPEYDSGIPGHPGARFVIDLKREPMEQHHPVGAAQVELATGDGTFARSTLSQPSLLMDSTKDVGTAKTEDDDDDESVDNQASDDSSSDRLLPERLRVLFVDDDRVLRKLFTRSINNLRPSWNVREAASGETAIRLIEKEQEEMMMMQQQQQEEEDGVDLGGQQQQQQQQPFDLIFVDMYMAAVEKQMLGTETVQEMRQRGVTCRLCGLSANDKEDEFITAGADAFMLKPFPCDRGQLAEEIHRILYQDFDKGGSFHQGACQREVFFQ